MIAVHAASVSAPTVPASPSSSTMSSAAEFSADIAPAGLPDRVERPGVEELQRCGDDPASEISATAAAARSMPVKVAASVDRDLGAGISRRSTSVITPSVPSEPTINASNPDADVSPPSPSPTIRPLERPAVTPATKSAVTP